MAEIAVERKDWTNAYQWASAVIASDLTHFRALIVLSRTNYAWRNFHEALGNALIANKVRLGAARAVLQIMLCQN